MSRFLTWFFMLTLCGLLLFTFYLAFKDGDYTRECERYEAARIPQDTNPCWGSVKK
jgi:hypothetical protein